MRQSLYAKIDVSKYPEKYVSLCCRCLIEGKITRGVFASYLDIDRADIDSYLNKFGFRENNCEEIPAAGNQRPSDLYPVSSFQLRVSNIEHPALSIQYPATSNQGYRGNTAPLSALDTMVA